MFAVYFHGQYEGSDGLIDKFDEMRIFTVRSDESLEKTLDDFQTQMNKYYWEFQEKYDSLLNGTYYLKLEYDKMNSTVSFQKIEINPPRDTEFLFWEVDKRSWAQFLRLLNQNEPLPPDGPFKFILPPADLMVYRNVFDPQNVMCHASFSSSNNSFLCIGKDFMTLLLNSTNHLVTVSLTFKFGSQQMVCNILFHCTMTFISNCLSYITTE
ncbi:hypothetical protein TVAGG3_0585880, partial [Trichomonas vaginalis G3]|uniref:hypothetical protein n=1 Tax=Trichomonas vaginalis (strain ATCC PRA-98 / G3) TaxID=412133 RepID=UPI0021E56384